MSELITKTIRVSGVSSEDGKITLSDGDTKYSFFKTKSGSDEETKAYAQYKSLRVEEGKEYPVAYKENQKEYKGKTMTFRNIMYFATKEAGEGYVAPRTEDPVERNSDPLQSDLQRRVAELELWRANMKPYLEKLVDELKSLRILAEEVAGKKATDLHVALKNRDIHEVKTPETAAAIVDSYKSDPSIPTINALPEGFEDK